MTTSPEGQATSRRPSSSPWEALLYAALLAFSAWIMFRTFSYDGRRGLILIGAKITSDFGANLPLIRSFSYGDNWPPEYPIFPGEPIRYHFLFFWLVGMLERAGLPIHWALNIPSILGFFAILAMIYVLGKRLFGDARVGLLGLVFFLFNGSLSFLQFFAKHPLSASTPKDVATAIEYTAMGPWDGGKVLGVWHLNVFVNQRHFCVALGTLMVFLFTCLWLEGRGRRTHLVAGAAFGIVVGFFSLLHKPVMLMFAVAMALFFLALPYLRPFLLVMGAAALGVMGWLRLASFSIAGPAESAFGWYPGFTAHGATGPELLSFLWHQFGLHLLLVPVGLVLAPRRARIFVLPALAATAIAFLFKFSPEVLANHKFINFGLMMGQMLSAYAIVRAWDLVVKGPASSPALGRIRTGAAALAAAAVVAFMTLSGVIDMFAIVNNPYIPVADLKASPAAAWFYANTPGNAVVLNSSFFHHPAAIAGRKIFLGWSYFTWGAGYPHNERMAIMRRIYAGGDPDVFCPLLRENHIGYMTVEDTSADGDLPLVNEKYFRGNFKPQFVSADDKYAIYSTEALCGAWSPR